MYILPNLKGKEIIIYLRKSRSDDPLATVEEVLEKHEQMINEWMAHTPSIDGSVPDSNIYREVVSGETLESRPKAMEMLRRIESPDIKAVVCKEPSRLSRGDLMDIGYLVKVLMYTGTLVLTPRECYDLRDDRDREQFERELKRGNDYLQYQKKILKDGKLLVAKNGEYIGTHPPYGYKKVSYKEGRRTVKTLEQIPEEAEVVKRIFDMFLSNIGNTRICDTFESEHITTPSGGKRWSPVTVMGILRNEHYIGKVRWYRTRRDRKVEDGEIKSYTFIAKDYLLFDGKHTEIIDMDTWERTQLKLGQIPRYKRGTELKNPLAGLLYCTCGKAMIYKQAKRNRQNLGVPRYTCGDSRCRETGSATCEEILTEVENVLRNCVEEFSIQIETGADNSAEVHAQTLARLEKRLEELRALEVKQWDEKLRGLMPDHIFERLNGNTVSEIEELEHSIVEARESAPVRVDLHERRVTFESALALLRDPDAPVKEKNALLRACIKRINYSRPKLTEYMGKRGNPSPYKVEFDLHI